MLVDSFFDDSAQMFSNDDDDDDTIVCQQFSSYRLPSFSDNLLNNRSKHCRWKLFQIIDRFQYTGNFQRSHQQYREFAWLRLTFHFLSPSTNSCAFSNCVAILRLGEQPDNLRTEDFP